MSVVKGTRTAGSDWWPSILRHIPEEKPLQLPMLTVAEMRNPNQGATYEYRTMVTALIPKRKLKKVSQSLRRFAELTTEISTSDFRGIGLPAYVPKFWLDGGELGRFETLTVGWRGASQTVLMPDQGLLMSYRLIPKVLDRAGEIHWYEPEEPTYDVVVAQPVSVHSYGETTTAFVKVRREFLEDYATVRNCALVQTIFESRYFPEDDELRERLGNKDRLSLKRSDHKILLRRFDERPGQVLAEVWAARILATPGKAPISLEDFGELNWPGIEEPVTKESAGKYTLTYVYVRDAVLGKFEDLGGYDIYPQNGGVSNGGQWSVSFCERLGRDIISLELRKLYEGSRPSIIRHWHSYAIDPPPKGDISLLRSQPNVATRSKAIVYALLDLAELIAAFSSEVADSALTSRDLVGLLRREVAYNGWWKLPDSEKVARHVSADLTQDQFLVRCGYLHQLIVEGWREGPLRKLIKGLGVPEQSIAKLRSLQLLNLVVEMAQISDQTGLNLRSEGSEVFARSTEVKRPSALASLFSLNELRQLADHRGGSQFKSKFDKALRGFGIDPKSAASGYGPILDRLYDGVIQTLASARVMLERGIS